MLENCRGVFLENQSRKESRKVQINKNLKISIILDLEVNINAPTFLSSHHRLCLSLSMTSQRCHRCNHAVVPPVHPGRPGRHARVHSQNQRARQAETAQDVRPGHVQLIGGQWQQHRVQVACTLCHSSPSFIFRHFQLNHGKKKKKKKYNPKLLVHAKYSSCELFISVNCSAFGNH